MILSGWKDIAVYLRCGTRTVQRWERMGLPVHRPIPGKRRHVVSYSEELDWWVRNQQPHHVPPQHVLVTIERARNLCADINTKVVELSSRMQTLMKEMTSLRNRRRKAGQP